MIVVRSPYRVSLCGGGTDVPGYFVSEDAGGAVFSFALCRYVYVSVSDRFPSSGLTKISYTRTEDVREVDEIEHELVRESVRSVLGSSLLSDRPLKIVIQGDLPGGTGLGSSSALTVGLLHALRAHASSRPSAPPTSGPPSPQSLADGACDIEVNVLGKPIGFQDQYASAYGWMRHYEFRPDGVVLVDGRKPGGFSVMSSVSSVRLLERHSLLFYTGIQRDANEILSSQNSSSSVMDRNRPVLREIRALADAVREEFLSHVPSMLRVGGLVSRGWALKRGMNSRASTSRIDEWHDTVVRCGAYGAKLLGAGGGGFLYVVAPPESHDRIRSGLGNPAEVPVSVSECGSEVVYDSEHG